jgi:hypothetical protein
MREPMAAEVPSAAQACHELLLCLAGRLPDQLLWRFRDWLGEDALTVIAQILPGVLLKHGIDLGPKEHELLVSSLMSHGADPQLVSSLLGASAPLTQKYEFSSSSPDRINSSDLVSGLVNATMRGRPGVGQVRQTWRWASMGDEVKRVLLVIAIDGLPRLAGELQRVLRVLGEYEPSIEVISPECDLLPYHLAALENSELMCLGAMDIGHRLVAV